MSNTHLEAAKAAAAEAAKAQPACPFRPHQIHKYHAPNVCTEKPSRPSEGHPDRRSVYNKLMAGGQGASMVPNTLTVTCPLGALASLEQATGEQAALAKGFDTTWIVENTSSKPVVLAWVVGGVEYSPFTPDLPPIQDPKALLKPGDWTSVPTFESFVYHVRSLDENGGLGDVVLQHRAGMIPLGGKAAQAPTNSIDPEPFDRKLLDQPESPLQEVGRGPTRHRHCNVVDLGFRNEAGFPLSVYWANQLMDVPTTGFTCAERYKFHMGVKAATQDFMWDWNSKTKYEGALTGHTFVARKADDPSIVVDKFTLEPTRIIDCPRDKKKQLVQLPAQAGLGEEVGDGQDVGNSENNEGDEDSCPNGEGNGGANGDGQGEDEDDPNTVFLPPQLPPRPGGTGFSGVS